MEKNIYIHALEIGSEYMAKGGITYNDLLIKLEERGFKLEGGFQYYFQQWFYKHFYVAAIYQMLNGQGYVNNSDLESYNSSHYAVLMENGYTEYLDFLKLEQAKIDTKKAHELSMAAIKWSRIAVYISVGMALIQIAVELLKSDNSCYCY